MTRLLKSGDGRMESRLLSPGGASADVEVYDLRFQPKAVHRSDAHSKGTTETLVVLSGSLRLIVEVGDSGCRDNQAVLHARTCVEGRCVLKRISFSGRRPF